MGNIDFGYIQKSKKKVAIVQANYIPRKGYFDIIVAVDEFILYDDMHLLSCAAGYNLRWLLRWIALFWASMLQLFTVIFGLPSLEIGMRAA